MGTTPNHVQLEGILRDSIAYLKENPKSKGASYLDTVEEAYTGFLESRAFTDRAYLDWRNLFNDALIAHKRVREAYDHARRQCQEWGVDGFPDRYVAYTEEEPTQEAAVDMAAFLKKLDLDAAWVGKAIERLDSSVAAARAALKSQEVALAAYRKKIKARSTGYELAYRTAREFFQVVSSELEYGSEQYYRLTTIPFE
ncbi:MAG: hypothetical protein KC561_12540 [Myxococcales bacterium]|nr:hypothetical protein [Myxococcales bacterium]